MLNIFIAEVWKWNGVINSYNIYLPTYLSAEDDQKAH